MALKTLIFNTISSLYQNSYALSYRLYRNKVANNHNLLFAKKQTKDISNERKLQAAAFHLWRLFVL